MKLLDLPTEVLLCVTDLLPLEDLKAFGATCHQLAAISTLAMQKRRTSLCISRRDTYMLDGGPPMLVLPDTILDGCHRSYRSITVDCLMHQTLRELVDLIRRPPIAGWEIKQLILNALEAEVAALFIQACGAIFNSVTKLHVTVLHYRRRQYRAKVVRLEMPNLREVLWRDLPLWTVFNTTTRYSVSLKAPLLRTLYQRAYRLKRFTLTLADDRETTSTGYHTLDYLSINFTKELAQKLETEVLTKLKSFLCVIYEAPFEHEWLEKSLARCMPNLQRLEISLTGNEMSMRHISEFQQLRELAMGNGFIVFEPERKYSLDSLRKLCLGNSRITSQKATIHLPKLTILGLCSNVHLDQQNKLDMFLPSLKYLYFDGKEKMVLNICECRGLEFLRLTIKDPAIMMPWVMSLDALTYLQIECRWSNCNNEYTQILSKAPNLTHFLLLTYGCSVDGVANLPTWCPKLRFLALHSREENVNFISHHTLRQIFSLPAIEEIAIGSLVVSTRHNAPIIISPRLRTLTIESLCTMMSQSAMFKVDGDHPEPMRFPIKYKFMDGLQFLSCNGQHYRAHLINAHLTFEPFKCGHFQDINETWGLNPKDDDS